MITQLISHLRRKYTRYEIHPRAAAVPAVASEILTGNCRTLGGRSAIGAGKSVDVLQLTRLNKPHNFRPSRSAVKVPSRDRLGEGASQMKAAVIISTYNSPYALEKVLWGYAAQTFRDFELIVADDGSSPATRCLIEHFDHEVMPTRHVWHEDFGFRKCTILNRAIVAADVDYLILSDGDCIPRSNFVETHLCLGSRAASCQAAQFGCLSN